MDRILDVLMDDIRLLEQVFKPTQRRQFDTSIMIEIS